MKSDWKTEELALLANIQTGPFGSQLHKEDYVEHGTPIVTVEHLGKKDFTEQNLPKVSSVDKKRLNKYVLKTGDIVFSRVGSVDRCSFVSEKYNGWMFSGRCLRIRLEKSINSEYLYYFFCNEKTKQFIQKIAVGATMPSINTKLMGEIPISYPCLKIQKNIANILHSLDEKISLNTKINKNLEQQAQAIFINMFPDISNGFCTIGDYITPKRGKSLLSKNAIFGDVPVIAGGLEPATYHNVANTKSPVLAISASGANAGYVSLWNIPIWSSDSSFIDSSMTDNVYFWYVLLKKRQKEIFDAQTGSVQPHVYPQHIASMLIPNLDIEEVHSYNLLVTPIFEMIGHNKDENTRLISTRDTLLPKLMSGELDVSDIDL